MSPGKLGMRGDVFLCLILVRVQSWFENSLEVSRRGDRLNLGHSTARLKYLIEDIEDNRKIALGGEGQ